ncbi:MAG TPA: DNA polymerase Y family protein [Vicinamibacterales bacterium]|nr:DNA polymerase Y family protein [Vicinamibacterales bacterium]
MDRWACVDIAAFPLQLLLKAHSEWARLPCAVVEDDKPQALVQFVNARAYKHGVRPGQRYATALALASDLQAGVMSPSQIEQHMRVLLDRLRCYSPHVEPSADTPGVFWLDAQGLNRLYPSLRDWAQAVRLEMQGAGMRATVAVGFTRFGVYALAKCHQGITVCEEVGEEHAAVQRVPLSSIDLEPDAQMRLAVLGIETMGAFLQLPADGIRQRFGAAAHALYQLAGGHRWAPLVPAPVEEPQTRLIHFDTPEVSTERLIFIAKRLLDSLLSALVAQAHAVVELTLWMKLDDRTTRTEQVRPAAPTLDATQLLAFIRLRLDTLRLSSGIVTLRITATTCPATSEQRRLFPHHARRDPELANQAFARLRAELGERSVVRARIGNAHLPAAQFEWEPLDRLPLRASPVVVTTRPLVRRIYTQPLSLAPGFRLQDAVLGPYTVSGGWWGGGVRRDYYFASTGDGNLEWVYYDHRQQRFFLQGCVE